MASIKLINTVIKVQKHIESTLEPKSNGYAGLPLGQ